MKKTIAYWNSADGRSPGVYLLKELSKVTELTLINNINDLPKENFDYQILIESPNTHQDKLKDDFLKNRFATKKVFYAVDPHLNFEVFKDWQSKYDIDNIFTPQKKSVNQFIESKNNNVFWLPFAADDSHFMRIPLRRYYDIGFVGTYNDTPYQEERKKLLLNLYKRYNLHPINYVMPNDMRLIYGSCKLGWNKSIKGELNMRSFEIPASGTAMITDEQDGLMDIFDSNDLIIYSNESDLYTKLNYYLSYLRKDDYISKAKKAYKKVEANHKYSDRVKTMLKILE